MSKRISLLAGMAGLLATSAIAQTTATATTDLNLRAEPNEMAEIIGVIPGNESVTVEGCADTISWCRVEHAGTVGWAYGDYLTTPINQQLQPLYKYREQAEVHRIETRDTTALSAAGGGTTGAILGAIVGGPVGAAAGAVIGGAAGAASDPGPQVVSYVIENPVEPVYVRGEVVEGAGLPDTVTVYPVPESQLSYVYVNNVPAIVNQERRIVRIVR